MRCALQTPHALVEKTTRPQNTYQETLQVRLPSRTKFRGSLPEEAARVPLLAGKNSTPSEERLARREEDRKRKTNEVATATAKNE